MSYEDNQEKHAPQKVTMNHLTEEMYPVNTAALTAEVLGKQGVDQVPDTDCIQAAIIFKRGSMLGGSHETT